MGRPGWPASWVAPAAAKPLPAPAMATVMLSLLMIAVPSWLEMRSMLGARGRVRVTLVPNGDVGSGVAITNLSDAFGAKLDFTAIERGGEIALQTF